MAVTGGAFEGVECAVGAGGHELAATVKGVTAKADGVVFEAFFVPSFVVGGVVVSCDNGLRVHHRLTSVQAVLGIFALGGDDIPKDFMPISSSCSS